MTPKKTSTPKRITFMCDPVIYDYLQAALGPLCRKQYHQINYLLSIALELREDDMDLLRFRKWLREYKALEVDEREDWLRKQLEAMEF